MPLDETALRRPDARLDVPIKLADGQEWHLPRPVVEFHLAFSDAGQAAFRKTITDAGEGYADVFRRFLEGEVGEQYDCLAEMTCRLLRLNYRLEDGDLVDLLPYRPADQANLEMWSKITGVATGTERPPDEQDDDTSS